MTEPILSDDGVSAVLPSAPSDMPVTEAETPELLATTAVLVEAVDLSKARIDADLRVIHNVRLIRVGESANRRHYDASVLEKAAPLFENVKSYSNHPARNEQRDQPERSVRDITGWFTHSEYRKDGIYATRHFTRNQAGQDSWALAEDIIAGRAPANLLELSINAIGKGKVKTIDGKQSVIVESIERVHSVDDVTTGAAGGSFVPLVAGADDDLALALLKEVSFEEWTEAQPEYIKRLQKQWQKVRLDESTKTAITEADRKVKTAEAATGESEQARLQLQAEYAALLETNTELMGQVQTLSRTLAVEKALDRVKLPATYKNDLRDELSRLAESEWDSKIDREIAKAKAANALPRVDVHGAGAQVSAVLPVTESTDPAPRDNESVADWMARMDRIKTKRN